MHTKDARKASKSEQRPYAVAAGRKRRSSASAHGPPIALTDTVTLIADTHIPATVYDKAGPPVQREELAHLTSPELARCRLHPVFPEQHRSTVHNHRVMVAAPFAARSQPEIRLHALLATERFVFPGPAHWESEL